MLVVHVITKDVKTIETSLRSRRFRGRIWNGRSLKNRARARARKSEREENGRSLKNRARAREEKRARGKWEGRKIKRLPENHMFLHLSPNAAYRNNSQSATKHN